MKLVLKNNTNWKLFSYLVTHRTVNVVNIYFKALRLCVKPRKSMVYCFVSIHYCISIWFLTSKELLNLRYFNVFKTEKMAINLL